MSKLSSSLNNGFRILFFALLVVAVLVLSLNHSFQLFHTIIELLSIVVAFTVFVVTWNAKKVLQNQYLYFVGVAYFFIASLDLMHTLTFQGMGLIEQGELFYANQLWIATRTMEAFTLAIGFYFLKRKKNLNADLLFLSYLVLTVLIVLSIIYWHIFPVCFIKGQGQTLFKITAEYVVIGILCLASYFLYVHRSSFDTFTYRLLAFSLFFTILSEFSLTLYLENQSLINGIGHVFKLISFYLIYKANVEKGFTKPTTVLFHEIKDSEFRYRTLANNLPVLIFRFDKDFNCTYSNAEERLTNGETLKIILSEIEPLLIKTEATKQPSLKSNIKVVNGQENQSYSLDIILENQQAGQQTYLVLCQDITVLKLAEEQLIELNATKDKFFSIIAHDLKNPFTTILASNELIHKSAPKLGVEKVQNLALRSHEAAKSAYSLLENLLSWSMIQTGVLKAKPEKIAVDSILERVVKNMRSASSSKGVEITYPTETLLQCYADINMLDTVLRNLLSNAIKFSFAATSIKITMAEDDKCIRFSVIDQGVGINETNLKDLLSNNTVVSKDGTAKEKGTGLGLQLCKDFIQLNGGEFNVTSAVGEGTTFEFWLPKFDPNRA